MSIRPGGLSAEDKAALVEAQRQKELTEQKTQQEYEASKQAKTPPKETRAVQQVQKAKQNLSEMYNNLGTLRSYESSPEKVITWNGKKYDLSNQTDAAAYHKAVNQYENSVKKYEANITKAENSLSSYYAQQKAFGASYRAYEVERQQYEQDEKKYKEKQKLLDNLEEKGLIEKVRVPDAGPGSTGYIYQLSVSTTSLSNKNLEALQKAGFNISTTKQGVSFSILNWGQKNTKEGSFSRAETEYYANVVGNAEQSVNAIYGRIITAITGKPTAFRSVSKETLEQLKDLSPQQKTYLAVGAAGGNFLANYVSTIPIGVASSYVFQGARSIASATGAATPAKVQAIAREISSHPNLARAIIWAPIAGVEASYVYDSYKRKKDLNDVFNTEIMRAGTLTGQIMGLETGFKLPTKVKEWVATRGRNAIPPEELWRQITLDSGKLPTYQGGYRKTWSKEFKDLAKQLSAEKYLGEVAPEEYRVWHGTRSPFGIGKGESLSVLDGTSLDKFPGLFVAPEPSPLRLPSGGKSIYNRLGLPGVKNISELASIDALVDVMPEGLSRSATQQWLREQIGLKTAYIPPVSMITSEMEAIIPPNSKLVKVGDEWYTNWAGHRVLVNKYVLVPEEAVASLPTGSRVVSLSSLASDSLPLNEMYLTYGIVPRSSSSKLTSSELSALAKEYSLPESSVESISSSLSSSLPNDLISPKISESKLTKKDIINISSPQPPSDISFSSTIEEPSPPSGPGEENNPPPPPKFSKHDFNRIRLKLYNGPLEKYRITLKSRRDEQIFTVKARSYIDAANKAQRAKKSSKYLPYFIDIMRLGT